MKTYKPNNAEIDATNSWDIWSKEPSKFEWEYNEKETCYIIEGEAMVRNIETNEEIKFISGDIVVFEKGLKCIWEIKQTIKKRYIFG